ncbi:MAG: DUF1553 domain-containing protein [Pirellulales bacterium]|nr:DUF1553 domain-containing protein [Pirellulales bacterium]
MRSRMASIVLVAVMLEVCGFSASVWGADRPPSSDWNEIRILAGRIDAELDRHLAEAEVPPGEFATDAEFLRRVYLDLAGRIPPVSTAREFLSNPFYSSREQLVDRVLTEPAHATNLARVWRRLLLPEMDANQQLRFMAPSLESWLRQQFLAEMPYDELVRALISYELPGADGNRGDFDFYEVSPLAFYIAKDAKPENLAASAARLFLGVQIECAQCHDHPFDNWKREQFWSLAGFFSGVKKQQPDQPFSVIVEEPDRHEITIVGTETVVPALFLDGKSPEWAEKESSRTTLAKWVTSRENPYFAKATMNRLWAHFFGHGLVDPVDDFSADNPPSHPELLELLAREFVAHDFNLSYMMRALVSTRAYQRSSLVSDERQADPRLFAVMPVRALDAERLLASFDEAVLYHNPNVQSPFVTDVSRMTFLDTFTRGSDDLTEAQTSIIQALTLMNGELVAGATQTGKNAVYTGDRPRSMQGATTRLMTSVLAFPGLTTRDRLELLYLATVTRPPRADELERYTTYIDSADKQQRDARLSDVLWALLNSSEFLTNH